MSGKMYRLIQYAGERTAPPVQAPPQISNQYVNHPPRNQSVGEDVLIDSICEGRFTDCFNRFRRFYILSQYVGGRLRSFQQWGDDLYLDSTRGGGFTY